MFHYDRGLKLTQADLAVDVCRRQPRGFVSHAHTDHMARHELALCTPATARLYHLRYGARPVRELPYREPIELAGVRLTTYPAGHCLGSAMLLADDGRQSLLYTGDFKLSASATAERAELPPAELLVIESTYGQPRYRLPPRELVIEQLVELVRRTLAAGQTPLVEAYALGKAQEVSRILTLAGVPVLQPKAVFAVSQVYRDCGVDLGDVQLLRGRPLPGHAVVAPPRFHRPGRSAEVKAQVRIAVTGWALDERTRFRLGVDHALPLSDHADYDELFEAIERVGPRTVYCTHGPARFVEHLREAGINAYPLAEGYVAAGAEPARQQRLF